MSTETSAPDDRDRARSVMQALEEIAESASVLAHEIKNPITAVNLALRAVARQLGEDEVSVLENLVQRMQSLEQRLRGALEYAQPLELERRPLDARELFEAVKSGVDSPPSVVELQFAVDDACPTIDGDPERLAEALVRLVENAFEACAGGGRVQLRAEPAPAGGVSISVDDDGPGIPESVRRTLFRPFATADGDRVGLGLARCKRLVEAHGGSIAVESSAEGARFRIVLPAAPGAQAS